MSTLTETVHTGEHVLSEANGQRSREKVTITGGSFVAGTVLGKITATGKYTLHDPAATDGSQTAAAVLYADVDAIAADQEGVVHLRDCEVDGDLLTWKTGITQNDKDAGIAALASAGVIVR